MKKMHMAPSMSFLCTIALPPLELNPQMLPQSTGVVIPEPLQTELTLVLLKIGANMHIKK